METLNNDELYYIAKFLKPEDLIRFKNTSRKLQSIIHESTILADRAYWQNYTKKVIEHAITGRSILANYTKTSTGQE